MSQQHRANVTPRYVYVNVNFGLGWDQARSGPKRRGVDLVTDATMTIRQMCEAFDVTPRTLRFYEAKELISPQRRGNQRLYCRRERARLTLILQGKRFGFSLEEMRKLLDLYDRDDGHQTQLAQTLDAARRHLCDLTARAGELQAAITDLQAMIARGEAELAHRAPAARQAS